MAINQAQLTDNRASESNAAVEIGNDFSTGPQAGLADSLNRPMLVGQNSPQAGKCHLPSLTKAELAEMLFEQVGLNKREATRMIESFFEEISNVLERGEMVKLTGFGNFQVRDKPQRPGRNLKTGEVVLIAARRVVTFHASQKVKRIIDVDSK